jgi:ketosteroid isomerase-like protein
MGDERSLARPSGQPAPASARRKHRVASLIERLAVAWNARDIEAFLAFFHPDYESSQPLHPERSFRGRDSVRQRWAPTFAAATDFQADLLGVAVDGELAWTEWHWHGTRRDGRTRDERGVIVYTVRDGLIVAGRVYMEPGPDDTSRTMP